MIYRCAPAKHLYICIATHTGWVTCETMMSVVLGTAALAEAGIEVSVGVTKGAAYPDHAYNRCATRFLASNATDLLILDYDVGTPGESFVKIARSDRPITVGTYPKRMSPIRWTVDFPDNLFHMDEQGFAYPNLAPTGFTRFNRAVFDILPCIEYVDDDLVNTTATVKRYFRTEVRVGQKYKGCDNILCEEWIAAGGEISLIPDLYFTHSGMNTWSGNFLEFVKATAESDASGPPTSVTQS